MVPHITLAERFERYCTRQRRQHAIELARSAAAYAGRVGLYRLEAELIRAVVNIDEPK